MNTSIVTVDGVIGDGPFVHVGDPTAYATSDELIVVGGDLGWAQWNGHGIRDRSDRSVGWFPVGIYRNDDLHCLRVLTSRWRVNAIAIHPAGRIVALGTGSYDGGYFYEGELLLHDVERGTTTSILSSARMVTALEWIDGETVAAVVAPPIDEDFEDHPIGHQSHRLRRQDWTTVEPRSVDLARKPAVPAEAAEPDPSALSDELRPLSKRSGLVWQSRRHVWAVTATDTGVLVGLESAVECWYDELTPRWRRSVDGTCTQLLPGATESVFSNLWLEPAARFPDRPTAVLAMDHDSGAGTSLFEPGHPAVIVTRSDGALLVRDTRHGRAIRAPAVVLSANGEQLGRVELSAYDSFNHYFDIRRAPQFLVLLGDDPKPWRDKRVAEVRRESSGRWSVRDLFALAWADQRHVMGGPGVFLDDANGTAIVHAGRVHDPASMHPGDAFVVRRRYPDGELLWHVPLDNAVSALDERDGRVVAATNLGELVVIDAASGEVIAREDRLSVDGHRVVPLSLALADSGRVWIGTLDGRVIQASLTCP